jgi:hypothetical protein
MFIEGSESIHSIQSEAEYAQLRLVDANVVAEIAEPLNAQEGMLVQHYPRVSDGDVHVQLGRQYREKDSDIEWPNSYKGRVYLQSNTGDSYLIVGNTFYDLSASEAAGEPVYRELDPDLAMPPNLIGNRFEYSDGYITGIIEMVEVSEGFSDSQGEHLDGYEMAGGDPFEKFIQRYEQVSTEAEPSISEVSLPAESEASLLTDFRTYPHREPSGLRARARQMIRKTGLAGKALLTEAREQMQVNQQERKYTRRRAALVAAIGVAAVGSMAFANGLLDKQDSSKPDKALIAPPHSPESVTAKTGDNPWEISTVQFARHGIVNPSGSEIAQYDNLFLATNFPHAGNLNQVAQDITPGNSYILPDFDSQEFKR